MRRKSRKENNSKRNTNADLLAQLEAENSELRHQVVELALKIKAMREEPSPFRQLELEECTRAPITPTSGSSFGRRLAHSRPADEAKSVAGQ